MGTRIPSVRDATQPARTEDTVIPAPLPHQPRLKPFCCDFQGSTFVLPRDCRVASRTDKILS